MTQSDSVESLKFYEKPSFVSFFLLVLNSVLFVFKLINIINNPRNRLADNSICREEYDDRNNQTNDIFHFIIPIGKSLIWFFIGKPNSDNCRCIHDNIG